MPRPNRSQESGDRPSVRIVFYDDDKDLLQELDEEVFRRKAAGERQINRNDLIKERLREAMAARRPKPPAEP